MSRSEVRVLLDAVNRLDSYNVHLIGPYDFSEVASKLPHGLVLRDSYPNEGLASIRSGEKPDTRAYLRKGADKQLHLLYDPKLPDDLGLSETEFKEGFEGSKEKLRPLF